LAAPLTPVQDGPLPVLSHPHADGLHASVTVRRPVPRLLVQMQTVQAVGAVVPVAAPCSRRHHRPSAHLARKGIHTGMCPEILLVIFALFIFSVHFSFLLVLSLPDLP